LSPVGVTTVAGLATVAATTGLLAAVVAVRLALVVGVLAGTVVAVVVVVGAVDVVVASSTAAAAARTGSADVWVVWSVRRMAGSLLRWGTPAMATPTAAHTTSMSTVTHRWPDISDEYCAASAGGGGCSGGLGDGRHRHGDAGEAYRRGHVLVR